MVFQTLMILDLVREVELEDLHRMRITMTNKSHNHNQVQAHPQNGLAQTRHQCGLDHLQARAREDHDHPQVPDRSHDLVPFLDQNHPPDLRNVGLEVGLEVLTMCVLIEAEEAPVVVAATDIALVHPEAGAASVIEAPIGTLALTMIDEGVIWDR